MKTSESKNIAENICTKLQNSIPHPNKNVFIGFDGFIDEIIHVVDQRSSPSKFNRIETISAMAERVGSVAGLSTNIELVSRQTKIGGNAPIMALSLQQQNYDIYYAGGLGVPTLHPIFQEFCNKCKEVFSFAAPGHTEALEFLDGKILLGKTQTLDTINWQNLLKVCPPHKLTAILENVALLSFNNWTMLYGMNSILEGILDIISRTHHKPTLFIDLADPSKRTTEDLKKVLELLKQYSKQTKVILSMNEKESELVSQSLNCFDKNVATRNKNIQESIALTQCIVHPVNGAYCTTQQENIWVEGPYTPTPKITTGAGDHFNAGYCNGYLRDLSITESLFLGVFTSGFYVRNGYSPNLQELLKFIHTWS